MAKPLRMSRVASLVMLASVFLLAPLTADARPVASGFAVKQHGFKFANTFNNDVIKEVDLRTSGLCGGMSYAAADYFHFGMKVPVQDYRPATGSTLAKYFYNRQVHSLVPNLPLWAVYKVNPDGMKNKRFFNSTTKAGGNSQYTAIIRRVRSRVPVPIHLVGYGGKVKGVKRPGDHQALCIGYEIGRYKGDGGAHMTDFKLHIYDPNWPDRDLKLVPDPADRSWYLVGSDPALKKDGVPVQRWRTWFVDKHYKPKRPPVIRPPLNGKPGMVEELVLEIHTGKDDLRGGKDNVNLIIHKTDGSKDEYPAINLRTRWINNYSQFPRVILRRPIPRNHIREVELRTTFRGGISGDNWNADSIIVWHYKGGRREVLAQRREFKRFTGRDQTVRMRVSGGRAAAATPGMITRLSMMFRTGGDDLRGGSSNVDVVVLYRDGRRQTMRTLNKRRSWRNNTEHTVNVHLERPVNRRDIIGVELRGTMRGGIGGDNWNLDKLMVIPYAGDDAKVVYYDRGGRPLHRFTGRNRNFTARW